MLKIIFLKKYYLNIFLNKKYVEKNSLGRIKWWSDVFVECMWLIDIN
jgi:hypothetical protein